MNTPGLLPGYCRWIDKSTFFAVHGCGELVVFASAAGGDGDAGHGQIGAVMLMLYHHFVKVPVCSGLFCFYRHFLQFSLRLGRRII